MFSGILLTVSSIGAMLAAGSGINMMFTWFNNFEPEVGKGKKKGYGGAHSSMNKEKIERLSNSFRP